MTLLIFLLILSILVLVHEFGHFIVAKLSGVKVEEFGIGFPPRIFSIKYGETVYSINALFFGGFVRLYGEEQAVQKDAQRAFSSKSKKTRAAIITAGVVMNLLLAIIAFSVLYSIVGIQRPLGFVRVEEIASDSPAEIANFSPEDAVVSVNEKKVTSYREFIQLIEDKKGKEVTVELRGKSGETRIVKVTPRENPPENEGPLGVAITDTEIYFPPLWQRPLWGTVYGLKEAVFWGKQIVIGIGTVFASLITQQKVPEGIAGPVGIFQLTGGVAQQGALALLHFLGVLSINLGILNIVPFPALDGGRLLFVGIEAVFRGRARAIIPNVERVTNMIGFGLLIALLVAITLQDIRRILGQ
ncbi:site-2 protease family protein [Candidatus Microgenomates bacterium]|nr:site-2 protease family protein [Candidatus Microgenomates bacterium]